MTPTAAERLLERRALELARPLDDAPDVTSELVVVTAARMRYALDPARVRAVLHNRGICRLPASTGALVGLVLVRGEAVPVADLAALLGRAEADLGRNLVVLLDGDQPPLGLLVDAVASRDLSRSLPAHLDRSDGSPPIERGVSVDGVVYLDAEVLLADPRLHLPAQNPSTPRRPRSAQESGDS